MFRLIFILLLVSGCAGTQSLAPDNSKIPFDVNTIIASSAMNQEEAYKQIGGYLISQGFAIENSTPEFYSLTTNYKSAKAGALQAKTDYSISVSVIKVDSGSEIVFSGKLRGTLTDEEQIRHKGQSGSTMRVAWDSFYNTVKSYSKDLKFETR